MALLGLLVVICLSYAVTGNASPSSTNENAIPHAIDLASPNAAVSPSSDQLSGYYQSLLRDLQKRNDNLYGFGLGKRSPYGFGLGKKSSYGFGLGKRASYGFGLGKKSEYGFGLGKKSSYGFGLGKRVPFAIKKPLYSFGIGRRNAAPSDSAYTVEDDNSENRVVNELAKTERIINTKRPEYAFGLGKRQPYGFGLGKRTWMTWWDKAAQDKPKRPSYSFGLGRR